MKTSSHSATRRTACVYNVLAAGYDRWWRGYVRHTNAALARAAAVRPAAKQAPRPEGGSTPRGGSTPGVRPGEAVLDAACGTGAFGERLLRTCPEQRYTGADASAQMLYAARAKLRRYPHVRLVRADVAALPFASGSFEVVVSGSALHTFADPLGALREARRVMDPGGRLVLPDWCRDDWRMRWMDAVLRRLDPSHRRTYTAAELHVLLRRAGFHVRRLRRFEVGWVWGLMVAEAVPARRRGSRHERSD